MQNASQMHIADYTHGNDGIKTDARVWVGMSQNSAFKNHYSMLLRCPTNLCLRLLLFMGSEDIVPWSLEEGVQNLSYLDVISSKSSTCIYLK